MNNHFPPKKFLFVSWESLSGDIAWQLKKEGHQVKIYIKDQDNRDVYEGFLERVDSWEDQVDWADVVVFDDIGFGKWADELRKKGKLVVGGSAYTDNLEDNREFGQTEMEKAGMSILPHWDFSDLASAIKFIRENPNRYVFKPNYAVGTGEDLHDLLFLGEEDDGKDILDILESDKKFLESKIKSFQLQKFASGVEVAVGAFFNGEDFIYPINVNFEHKRLFPGEIGPFTGEMGTAMYWSQPNAIFNETLLKTKDKLKESGYVGYIDINCIANARGIYPLEWTCFSDDTEILTKEGWKLFKDVKKDEIVATLNPSSHRLEYQKITGRIVKKHQGEMISISGAGKSHQAIDCLVTPDHQMYVKKRNGQFAFTRADSIPQGSKIKRGCYWAGKKQKIYTVPGYTENHYLGRYHKVYPIKHPAVSMPMDVWLKFLGIFLAEGSIGGRKHIVMISQYSKKEIVRELLQYFPFRVKENKSGFQISSTQLVKHLLNYNFGRCNTKYVPDYVKSLASGQIKVFLDAFMVGDGHIHKRTGQISYFSTSKKIIDDIQELLLKCGIAGNIRIIRSKGTKMLGTKYFRKYDLHFIAERKDKIDYYVDKRNIKKISYDGKVYCVEVPNHIIYVRRNGKAFWAGNCRFGYPTINIQMEGILTPIGELFYRLASKEKFELKTKKGFQIGVVVALTPYISVNPQESSNYRDLSILFRRPNPDLEGIHIGDVKLVDNQLRVAGSSGYVLIVTGSGQTVEETRKQTYNRVKNIRLQNMFYRVDIGTRWYQESDKLQIWGYL